MKVLFTFVALTLTICASSAHIPSLSQEFIDFINRKQSSWIAGRNFPEETTKEQLYIRAGSLGVYPDANYKLKEKVQPINLDAIPETFDARTEWPNCPSLNRIRNQGACGSCWAFAGTESLSDRACIHSSGSQQFIASPEEVIECCDACGNCNGGYVMHVFDYYISDGLVSGGDANSNEGCLPYSADAFNHGENPSCTKTCRSGYPVSYAADKHYGSEHYIVTNNFSVPAIQTDLMTNGPIAVSFDVYEDFFSYKSGIYYHVQGDYAGGHAVKLIGWGTENGVPYWLIANSWGADWGDLHGFFKIRRGVNECGIERYPYAVIPKL